MHICTRCGIRTLVAGQWKSSGSLDKSNHPQQRSQLPQEIQLIEQVIPRHSTQLTLSCRKLRNHPTGPKLKHPAQNARKESTMTTRNLPEPKNITKHSKLLSAANGGVAKHKTDLTDLTTPLQDSLTQQKQTTSTRNTGPTQRHVPLTTHKSSVEAHPGVRTKLTVSHISPLKVNFITWSTPPPVSSATSWQSLKLTYKSKRL